MPINQIAVQLFHISSVETNDVRLITLHESCCCLLILIRTHRIVQERIVMSAVDGVVDGVDGAGVVEVGVVEVGVVEVGVVEVGVVEVGVSVVVI